MYLIDSCVFLSILLDEDKKEDCKDFLYENLENSYISEFSINSICITLFNKASDEVFRKFLSDILDNINMIKIPYDMYTEILNTKNNFGLDFDDSYQYYASKMKDYKLITLDSDFEGVNGIEVEIL